MNELKEQTDLEWFEYETKIQASRHNVLGVIPYGSCAKGHIVYSVTVGMKNAPAPHITMQFCECFSPYPLGNLSAGDEVYLCPPQIVKQPTEV